ncbi:MAG: hypothetical protein MK118_01185 [Dehalococcoidia bacterium]|nr:hypothetical protein [Dehalococcoidia bacterium]
MFLTAASQERDKLRGLRSGADDYITKPFSGEEHLLSAEESPDVKAGLRKVVGVSAATENILDITLADPDPTLLQKLALAAASSVRQDVIEMYGANWTEPGNYLGNGHRDPPVRRSGLFLRQRPVDVG